MDLQIKYFEDLCRICLENKNDNNFGQHQTKMTTIFDATINSLNLLLVDLFTSFTGVKLEQITGFPTLICSNCLDTLVSAYEFQLKCIKSDNDIRMAFGYASHELPLIEPKCELVEDDPIISEPTNVAGRHTWINDDINDKPIKVENDVNFSHPPEDTIVVEPLQLYKCPHCPKKFSKRNSLNGHMSAHRKLFDKQIKDDNQLMSGISILTADRPLNNIFKCAHCDREFSKKTLIKKHMNVHKRKMFEIYSCEHCPQKFSYNSQYKAHLITHTTRNSNCCDICNKTYLTPERLQLHIDHKHNGIKSHICSTCNKGFQNKSSYIVHMQTHNTCDKRFLCTDCGKSFKKKTHFQVHTAIHTNIRPFKCEECERGFVTSKLLEHHMAVHTGQKKYACELCGNVFTRYSSLYKHKLIHANERRYSCKLCEKRFNTSSGLCLHVRSHTGENRHECDICSQLCLTRSALNKHKHIKHGETIQMRQCKECPAEFRFQRDLNKHHQEHYLKRQQDAIEETKSTIVIE